MLKRFLEKKVCGIHAEVLLAVIITLLLLVIELVF